MELMKGEIDRILTTEKNMTSIFEPALKRGIQKGRLEGLKDLIRIKFGKVPDSISKKIDQLNEKQLQKVQSRIFKAESPESLFDN